MTKATTVIDEKKVWEDDVKSMSYDDLMAAIRYLDQERAMLSKGLVNHHGNNDNNNKNEGKQTGRQAA